MSDLCCNNHAFAIRLLIQTLRTYSLQGLSKLNPYQSLSAHVKNIQQTR